VSRRLGLPRLHYRSIDSTNRRARELAGAGAPDGTLVTASEQTAGRGRQGRTWTAAPGRALLGSIVVRDPPRLLPLAAGVAVAETVEAVAGSRALVKWPNDVHVDGRKVAGILVEGRPQEGWAVIGIGLNVALRDEDFPVELRASAATLGLTAEAVEPTLARLLASLAEWIDAGADAVLSAVRERDALLGQPVRWAGGSGRGAGIDGDGRLVVALDGGGRIELDAGEVHLGRAV
jgi:BirA family biotin operon repressor/biotin-[acetyl-CoA-carboxylase] ligase